MLSPPINQGIALHDPEPTHQSVRSRTLKATRKLAMPYWPGQDPVEIGPDGRKQLRNQHAWQALQCAATCPLQNKPYW